MAHRVDWLFIVWMLVAILFFAYLLIIAGPRIDLLISPLASPALLPSSISVNTKWE